MNQDTILISYKYLRYVIATEMAWLIMKILIKKKSPNIDTYNWVNG